MKEIAPFIFINAFLISVVHTDIKPTVAIKLPMTFSKTFENLDLSSCSFVI